MDARSSLCGVTEFGGPVQTAADADPEALAAASVVACIGTDQAMLDLVPYLVAAGHQVRVFEDNPRLILPDGGGLPSCARVLSVVASQLDAGMAWARVVPALSWWQLPWRDLPVHLRRRAGSLHRRRSVRDRWTRRQLTPSRHDDRSPLHSDEYFRVLASGDCRLVSWPIARVTSGGIRTCDGLEHRVDYIIVAG